MKFQMRWVFFIVISAFAAACSSSPVEVKEVDSFQEEGASAAQEIFNTKGNNASSAVESESQWVECEVFETLETDRYSYLHVVQNGGDTAWVATRKADFVKGGVYRYRNGLLKTNYYSTEFDRTFDRILLVSEIQGRGMPSGTRKSESTSTQSTPTTQSTPVEGSMPIADVVENAGALSGKNVQISGEVVKVNPNIMGRNWIHLQDGTLNSFDFVVTSDAVVPVGHTVTFRGVLQTDRDFGSGYSYDIILEQGILVQ
jgi:hypothetical protein